MGSKRTQERLVGTATTGNNADHATRAGVDDLLGTRGQLDAGLALVGVVADNSDVVAGGTAQGATVTDLLLDVGDDGTLGHGAQGQDVADGQGSLLSGVDELASVHALVGDEGLGHLLESVGVAEDDLGEGSTATCVAKNPSAQVHTQPEKTLLRRIPCSSRPNRDQLPRGKCGKN